MTSTELPPVPHRVREGWLDLCGEWEFGYDAAPDGEAGFDRTITAPYPPESELSGIADRGFHAVVRYRRSVAIARADGRRVVLHLSAVDYRATVWANGQLVADEVVSQPSAATPSEAVDVFWRRAQREGRR
ncbi:hypothetical protein E1218_24855 [Kribbella turkmenica]|uniref:Glycosyl hydrolases family 2 sugar binding domain-containing protein n=1 Tax=Kribbella turkmenica TaxID=2530375 RepID=A0A4R4WRT0_9ACTN|nr:hypothetical protein [Kribbella turkmenica]TDD19010.1 hypothetical protein E1218_24855 [Kribbella turkmenica]